MNLLGRDVTLLAACGRAHHEVIYRVVPWGHTFRVFTPCDALAGSRLLGGRSGRCQCLNCSISIFLQAIAMPYGMEQDWVVDNFSTMDSKGELAQYVCEVKSEAVSLARQQLRRFDECALVSYLRGGDARCLWSAAVMVATLEKQSSRIISALRSIHLTQNPVTRSLALLQLAKSKSRDSKACVIDSINDVKIALFVRDELVRRLCGQGPQYPLSQITCTLQGAGQIHYQLAWSELREIACCHDTVVSVRPSLIASNR